MKSGVAPGKPLNSTKQMLMDKMKYFEPYVADVFTNVISSSHTNKKANPIPTSSVWKVHKQTSQATETKRKVPQPSQQYAAREDKKDKLFKLVENLAEKVSSISDQSQKILTENREKVSTSSGSTSREDQSRKALLDIVDEFFINLSPVDRGRCLAEMLEEVSSD